MNQRNTLFQNVNLLFPTVISPIQHPFKLNYFLNKTRKEKHKPKPEIISNISPLSKNNQTILKDTIYLKSKIYKPNYSENKYIEVKDSFLNTFQNFIIIKKEKEFRNGVSILKLKQDEFEDKISFHRKVTPKMRSRNKKIICSYMSKFPDVKKHYKSCQNEFPLIQIKKPKKLMLQSVPSSQIQNYNLTQFVPNFIEEERKKKKELCYITEFWNKNHRKKPFK